MSDVERKVCGHVLDSGGDDGACGECYGAVVADLRRLSDEIVDANKHARDDSTALARVMSALDEARASLARLSDTFEQTVASRRDLAERLARVTEERDRARAAEWVLADVQIDLAVANKVLEEVRAAVGAAPGVSIVDECARLREEGAAAEARGFAAGVSAYARASPAPSPKDAAPRCEACEGYEATVDGPCSVCRPSTERKDKP